MHALEWIGQQAKPPRYIYAGYLRRKLNRQTGECTWCGSKVVPPKRRWCSRDCRREYEIRCTSRASTHVWRRDKGVCARCGLDTRKLRRAWNDACTNRTVWDRMVGALRNRGWTITQVVYEDGVLRYALPDALWEADHIVPVAEGGGLCALNGYQTLCRACHVKDTAKLAQRLARQRKVAAGQAELFG